MSKRFFYVSLGVLALALSWHLGARSARADSDFDGLGCVAGVYYIYYYDSGGECYYLNETFWGRLPDMDLPVPASDVKFTGGKAGSEGWTIVTHADEVYVWQPTAHWVLADPFPGCGGTATEKSSWGGIKKQFR